MQRRLFFQALDDLQTPYINLFLLHMLCFYNLSPEEEKRRQEGYFFDYSVVPTEGCEKLGFNIVLLMPTWRKLEEYYQRAF